MPNVFDSERPHPHARVGRRLLPHRSQRGQGVILTSDSSINNAEGSVEKEAVTARAVP